MDSSNKESTSVEWLLTKRFRVKRGEKVQLSKLFIGLGSPQKLRKTEKNAMLPDHSYGCMVQTGKSYTRHFVLGRDPFSALAHAVLALEQFLFSVSVECEIYEMDGKRFDKSIDLVLLGPIGHAHLKASKAVSRNRAQQA